MRQRRPKSASLRRERLLPLAGFVLALLSLLAWGLSSPVGSSPDDDFHLNSIWCGSGDRAGLCTSGADEAERTVPVDLALSPCYAYDPEKSAACQADDFGTHPGEAASTARGNFDGLYPPVFYFVMSAFAGPNIPISVVAMRIFAALFFIGIVAGLYALLPPNRRPQLIWPLVITMVPLGLSLIPSTNPSGWALLSAGTLWIALVGYFETTGWRRAALGAMAVLSTLIGAGARADAAAFAVVSVGIALIVSFTPTRRYFLAAILPLALILVAAYFFLTSSQSAASTDGLNGLPPVTTEALKSLLLVNTLNVPQLWAGVFGLWGLGWLDTALPAAVWTAGFGVFVFGILSGARSMNGRKGLALGLTFFAVWAFPMVLLVQSQAYVGAYVQPRYVLPLIVIFAGIALLRVTAHPLSAGRVQIAAVIGALSLANAVALHSNIRRYVTGDETVTPNLDSNVEWWWSMPISPMGTWAIGAIAFTGMMIVVSYPLWVRGRERAADDALAAPPTGL